MAETITVSSLNNALKVYAHGAQKRQFNNYSMLHSRLKSVAGKAKLGGRTFEISHKHRGGGSWRTLEEMEPLPHPGSPGYTLSTVPTKTWASVVRLSLQGWLASKGQERAWVDGKIDAFNDAVEQGAQRCGQMWFRDGTGAIARVNGNPVVTPTGGTFVVDASMSAGSNDTFGNQYAVPEMRLSASANLTGLQAERTFDARLVDTNDTTLTWTVDGQMGDLADGDYIFIGSKQRTSKNRDYMGLLGIVDDGTKLATLQGIDRTAAGFSWWQANRLANLGAADLENVWQYMSDEIDRRNRGKISDIITTYGVRRRFVQDLKTDRRFNTSPDTGDYKGGFSSVKWMDGNNRTVDVWVDKDCPNQAAFLLDWSTFAIASLSGDPQWLDQGEGILKWVNDTLGYQAVYFQMGNLITYAPNRNAICLGITEA